MVLAYGLIGAGGVLTFTGFIALALARNALHSAAQI